MQLHSTPVRWAIPKKSKRHTRKNDDKKDDDGPFEKLYRSEIVVERKGEGRFPVDVRLVFEDGHQEVRRWDGQERWIQYVVERPSKIESAEVDPDEILMLDASRTNNSRLRKKNARLPATKWSSKWMIWLQDMMSSYAFFF